MSRHSNKNNLKNIVTIILTLICIISLVAIAIIKHIENKDNENQEQVSAVLNTIEIEEKFISEEETERMLQVQKLQKENKEIIGWIEIEGTNINYPVLQGQDNDYYLEHNYKGEKVSGGSIFLDKNYDFSVPSCNLLIYGHRNKKGLMFEDLVKYKNEEFYKEHPTIRFTTAKTDCEYEIIAVFNSRVYYQNETDVFRYYYFIDAENKEQYEYFVNNAKAVSLYDTGKTAEYKEQLLTLSTCDYTQENGRFAVVAKKRIL